MAEESQKDETQRDERNGDRRDPQWEGFKDYVRKISAVPKEELNEQRAKHERERRQGKKTGS